MQKSYIKVNTANLSRQLTHQQVNWVIIVCVYNRLVCGGEESGLLTHERSCIKSQCSHINENESPFLPPPFSAVNVPWCSYHHGNHSEIDPLWTTSKAWVAFKLRIKSAESQSRWTAPERLHSNLKSLSEGQELYLLIFV